MGDSHSGHSARARWHTHRVLSWSGYGALESEEGGKGEEQVATEGCGVEGHAIHRRVYYGLNDQRTQSENTIMSWYIDTP
jgi:hypothetical protein